MCLYKLQVWQKSKLSYKCFNCHTFNCESGNKIINFQDYNAQTIGIILLWLSAFLTLYTGYDYVRKGIDHAINEDKNKYMSLTEINIEKKNFHNDFNLKKRKDLKIYFIKHF